MITVGLYKELKMTETQVHEKIQEQSEAINMIAKELTFLLTEANKHNPVIGTPLASELAQRFMALYKDFQIVQKNTVKLFQEVNETTFADELTGIVYKATAHLLVEKIKTGLFEQFISVAEFGELPDGTTFEDEDNSI
jgi:hypothetical protein